MPVRVLVVDDQEIVRNSLSLLFDTEDKIEVVGMAGTGEEAIDQNQKLRPDVILMDLRMPGIGGLEAARQIHSDYPSTKIIILTALRGQEKQRESIEAGAIGFLQKDTSAHSLITVIKDLVESNSV
jgi:DNA-binding NarL/FixJ family response regulator